MKFNPIRAAAALSLVLTLAACGDKASREELSERVAELEDENDLLRQQLEDARFQAEEAAVAAERARAPAPPAYPPAFSLDTRGDDDIGPDSAAEAADIAPRIDRASAVEAAAAEAAETARQALGAGKKATPPLAADDR